MNILFVNYGDFASNSLNHIGAFAGRLSVLDHSCIVAVPKNPQSISAIPIARFIPASFDELLEKPKFFPDGRGADIIHAWTPRENVREFVLSYLRLSKARLVIHLEDNEEYLTQSNLGLQADEVFSAAGMAQADKTAASLSHPLRHRLFLRAADAITVIVPSLRDFVPSGIPTHELAPGIDTSLYHPQGPDAAVRRQLNLAPDEKLIVFTGSNTFANELEVRDLYLAVGLLNDGGIPTRLVRTGHFSGKFHTPIPEKVLSHVSDLGFVEKTSLPGLLALADVVVQPGSAGPFNDYRLPSKIPELLAMGLPAVIPATNVGLELKDGEEALLLHESSPHAIADACSRIFSDPALARRIREGAFTFARKRYDLEKNTAGLIAFYQRVLASEARPGSASTLKSDENETSLALRSFAEQTGQAEFQTSLRQLAPYLFNLEKNIHCIEELAHTRDTLTRTEHNLALARDHAAIIERERELTAQHVRNLKAMVADSRKRVEELDGQCASLEKQILSLNEHNSTLSRHLGQRNAKIAAMEASYSWKLTAPLRWIRRRFQKT